MLQLTAANYSLVGGHGLLPRLLPVVYPLEPEYEEERQDYYLRLLEPWGIVSSLSRTSIYIHIYASALLTGVIQRWCLRDSPDKRPASAK